MVDDASCHLSCYTSTNASIWHRYRDMASQRQWGHVTSSITWPFNSWGLTSYGQSIVTMHLSSIVMEIWPFKVILSSRNRGRSSVGQSSILHWLHILLFATLGT